MASPNLGDYPIDPEVLAIQKMMEMTLEKVVAVYNTMGVPLPSRQYWCFGQPAFDCEQIVVSFLLGYLGAPGNQASEPLPCNSPRSAALQISVVRKAAASSAKETIPSADKIQSMSEWQAADATVLLGAVSEFNDWGDGIPGLGVIATLDAPTADGAYQAVNLQLTVGIPL